MNYNDDNASQILGLIENCLKQPDPASHKLKRLWAILCTTRSLALGNSLQQIIGNKVHGGIFKGMLLPQGVPPPSHAPMLLGCYEQELQPLLKAAISKNYTRIINIGCSIGYYAVGLAQLMPDVTVNAFDIDPIPRAKCVEMTELNNVQDRVHVSGQFYGDQFAHYSAHKTLVLMDIEGAEDALLDPFRYPALQKMDIIVELHDVIKPGLSKTICERFTPSHEVELIKNQNVMPALDGLLSAGTYVDSFDQFLMGWEGRDGPTPWGIFITKA